MIFYRICLGGELFFQTIGESPMAKQLPPEMQDCILHSSLTNDGLTLMASDIVGDQGLVRGNNVSLMLSCSSESDIQAAYNSLSAGGQPTHPLETTYWGALFGGLTDKFGIHWLLNYTK